MQHEDMQNARKYGFIVRATKDTEIITDKLAPSSNLDVTSMEILLTNIYDFKQAFIQIPIRYIYIWVHTFTMHVCV